MSNMELQVVCPECLLHSKPRGASTWSWDSINAAAKSGNPTVICIKGHRVDSTLLCGVCPERKQAPHLVGGEKTNRVMNIKEVLPSVVLVCVWDHESKQIISSGSGFIYDKKLGLIITAGHVMFR
jgi:S1-C subfamily serine protease